MTKPMPTPLTLAHINQKNRWRNFRLTGKQVDKLTSKYALHHLLC